MSTPTSVYRYLDADGVLIYVGITNRGVQRQGEHNTHAKWWRFVRSQEVEHYDDRETAARRERYLIERFRPPFNTQHNPEHLRLRSEYLAKADPTVPPCRHCEESRDLVTADEAMRLVVDDPEWHTTADLNWYENTAAEDARRRMEAEIAERGIAALVDEAASRRVGTVA